MIQLITPDRYGAFLDELAEMHRLRYRIFKERLGWDVEVSGDMEIDEFDACRPAYLLQRDDDGRIQGCVRLLPTTGPTMLRDTFPRCWTDSLRRRPIRSGRAAGSASISARETRRRGAASRERRMSCSPA